MSDLAMLETSITADAIALLAVAEKNVATARALIGQTILARRTALDLGLRQLARIARVDASELSRVERGHTRAWPAVHRVDEALTILESERAAARLRTA